MGGWCIEVVGHHFHWNTLVMGLLPTGATPRELLGIGAQDGISGPFLSLCGVFYELTKSWHWV